MKKNLFLFSSLVLFLLLGSMQNSFATCSIPTIALTATAPTIDGNIDAIWNNATKQSIELATSGNTANNPAGRWRGLYDNDAFYFLIEVNDPQAMVRATDGWDGDAVEIFLQAKQAGVYVNFQIGFPYRQNTTVDGGVRYGAWGGYFPCDAAMQDVVTTYNGTTGGYTLEVKILKSSLELSGITTGDELRMEMAINQTNNLGGTGRYGQLAWNSASPYHANTATNYTYVPLSDCSINIPVTGLSISPDSITIATGYEQQIIPTIYPNNATNKTITWVSSNPAIATVSPSGIATGVSIGGPVTITATSSDGGFTSTSIITVTAIPAVECLSPTIVSTNGNTPNIDNIIETVWGTAPTKTIGLPALWSPPNVPAGQFRTLHDENNLYFLVEVLDNIKTAGGGFNGDAINIYIDGLGNGGAGYYSDADDTAYGYSYSPTNPTTYELGSSTQYKMHDVANGYVLEVAIPWSVIGVTEKTAINNGSIAFEVVIDQASGAGRIGQVSTFVASDTIWRTPSILTSVPLDCYEMKLTGSNNEETICLGTPVTLTVDHSLTGTDYTWYKRESGQSAWNQMGISSTNTYTIFPSISTEYKVKFATKFSNILSVHAVSCCSETANKIVLYKEDFGTLPTMCSRANTTVVPASPDMQYADNNIFYFQFVNDGFYAVVANPNCAEHGSSPDPWFLPGYDHTGNGDNTTTFGGMLLVNNGAASVTVFSKTIKNPCVNTTLEFTSWFANACRVAGNCPLPVNLTFKVYGQTSGTWSAIPNSTMETGNLGFISDLTWFQKGTTFNSGSYDSLKVEITNNGSAGYGNDALIDDILFTACAPSVNLFTDIVSFRTDSVACNNDTITLTPMAGYDLTTYFATPNYLIQYSNDSTTWTNILPVVNTTNPSWDIDTQILSSDTTFYRVIVGNSAATALAVAAGTYSGGDCMLYTITNVSRIYRPTFLLGSDTTQTVCAAGDHVLLTGTTNAVEWQWEDAAGNIIVSRSSNVALKTLDIIITQDSVVYFRAFDLNGCNKRQTFSININAPITLTPTSPAAVCAPAVTSIVQAPEAGYTFAYYLADQTTIVADPANIATAGTYYITKTNNATTCVSDFAAATVTINSKPTISVTSPAAVCAPALVSIVQTAEAGYTFAYYLADQTTIVADPANIATAGTYYINKTNTATTCISDFAAVTVTVNSKPTLTPTSPAAVCAPAVASIVQAPEAGYTFTYYLADQTTVVADPANIATAGTYYITKTNNATTCVSDFAAVSVTINSKPTLTPTSPAAVCAPAVASILQTAEAGYTFTYFLADQTTVVAAPANIATGGTYYITKTNNATTCVSDFAAVTVTVNSKPTLTPTSPAAVCAPAVVSIVQAPEAGYTFTYYLADQTTVVADPANIATGGTYYITKTNNATTCVSDFAAVTVTVNSKPTLTPTSPAAVCAPALVSIVQAPEAGYTFAYYLADQTTVVADPANIATAGTYYITKTNTATTCVSNFAAVTVTINSKPTLTPTSPAAVCAPAIASIVQAPEAGYTFAYYLADQTTVVADPTNIATAGTYYITKTNNATTCVSDFAAVTVTVNSKPTLTPTSPAAVCAPAVASIVQTAEAGYTFAYYLADQTTVVVDPANIATGGTYYITKTNNTTTCVSDFAAVSVTINSKPTLTPTSPAAVCAPAVASIVQAPEAGYTFAYFLADQTTVVADPANIATGGTYYITKTNTATTCVSDFTAVSVAINPLPTISFSVAQIVCTGGTGNIDATIASGTPLYTYDWNSGTYTTEDIAGLSDGLYTLIITDSNGCTATSSATIDPAPAIPGAPTVVPYSECAAAGTENWSDLVTSIGIQTWYDAAAAGSIIFPTTYDTDVVGSTTYWVSVNNGCESSRAAVTVEVKANPMVSISTVTQIPCNTGTGELIATASGIGALSYSWSPSGGTSATATGLSAGVYTVTVTDAANSCFSTANATINAAPSPLVASIASYVDVACFGDATGSANAGAAGGTAPYNYSWNTTPVQNVANATNLSGGDYTVTVTDANLCTATANVSILPNQALNATISAQTNVLCNGDATGDATVSVTGGTAGYTYSWPSGGAGVTESGLSAGSYIVTVTDANLCTTTATANISEPLTPITANVNITQIICSGGTGAVQAVASGGTGTLTYSWDTTPTETTAIVNNLSDGTYTLTVTDENLCTATANGTINAAPVSPLAPSILPYSDCAKVGTQNWSDLVTSAGVQTWYDAPVAGNVVNPTTYNTNTAGTTTYWVSVNNGCESDLAQVDVTVNPNPTVDIIAAGNVLNCVISNITLTAQGTDISTYTWNDGSINTTLDITTIGTYSVEVESTNGCITNSAPFVVTQSPNIILEIKLDNTSGSVCEGDQVTLHATTAAVADENYKWEYSDDNGTTWQVLSSTTYTLTDNAKLDRLYKVSSDDVCVAPSDNVSLDVRVPITDLVLEIDKQRITPGETATLTAVSTKSLDTYFWTDNNKTTTTNQHTVRLYTDKTFTVEVSNGVCPPKQDSLVVKVIWPTAITPYDKDGMNDEFLIYADLNMFVFNRYGQEVYKGRQAWDGTYKGQTADPGTYFYTVELPDGNVKKGTIEIIKAK